jgi:hypothetical protein
MKKPMDTQSRIDQILNTWRVHNEINIYLLSEIPEKGLQAVPLSSKGRTVAARTQGSSWVVALSYHRQKTQVVSQRER